MLIFMSKYHFLSVNRQKTILDIRTGLKIKYFIFKFFTSQKSLLLELETKKRNFIDKHLLILLSQY